MKVTWQFSGGDELAKRLNALPAALTRKVVVEALRAAARPMQAGASARAPYQAADDREPFGHLRDRMVISVANRIGSVAGGRWTKRDEMEHAVAVGPAKNFAHGLFQEYGTAHHGPNPFMRAAFDSSTSAALGIIGQELWAALRKAIPPQTSGSSRFL